MGYRFLVWLLATLLVTVPVASASDGRVDWRNLLRADVAASVASQKPVINQWQEPKPPAGEPTKSKQKTKGDHCTGILRGSLAVAAGLVGGGVYLLATSNQDIRQPDSSFKQERSGARVAGGVAAIVAGPVIALKMAMAGGCD